MNETSYYLYNSAIKTDSQPWSYLTVSWETMSTVHILAQENANFDKNGPKASSYKIGKVKHREQAKERGKIPATAKSPYCKYNQPDR